MLFILLISASKTGFVYFDAKYCKLLKKHLILYMSNTHTNILKQYSNG